MCLASGCNPPSITSRPTSVANFQAIQWVCTPARVALRRMTMFTQNIHVTAASALDYLSFFYLLKMIWLVDWWLDDTSRHGPLHDLHVLFTNRKWMREISMNFSSNKQFLSGCWQLHLVWQFERRLACINSFIHLFVSFFSHAAAAVHATIGERGEVFKQYTAEASNAPRVHKHLPNTPG